MTTTIPKQETCIPPSERVPIMIEITEQDRQQARGYGDIHNCLICTTLRRYGYKDVLAGGMHVLINHEEWYHSKDISYDSIGNYKKAVGKQIILYPGHLNAHDNP